MPLILVEAANRALAEDVGLIVTFVVIIGVLVGVIAAYIALQLLGEHRQNRAYQRPGSRRPASRA